MLWERRGGVYCLTSDLDLWPGSLFNALPVTSVTVQGPMPVSYVLVRKWSRCDSMTVSCFAWRTFFAL